MGRSRGAVHGVEPGAPRGRAAAPRASVAAPAAQRGRAGPALAAGPVASVSGLALAGGLLQQLQSAAGNGAVTNVVSVPPVVPTVVVSRDPDTGPRPADDAPADVPARYARLLRPSLTEAQTQALGRAVGGAPLVEAVRRRDALRLRLEQLDRDRPSAGVEPAEVVAAREDARAQERELTARIERELAALGVPDERALVALVERDFPEQFLEHAKTVAQELLADNEREALAERDRYALQVCSPDLEGLLEADRTLASLDYRSLEISVAAAERVLSRYAPSAGVLTPAELVQSLPESERSVGVDIANLDRNRQQLPSRRAVYDRARLGLGRRFPLLLSDGYRPGSFAGAPPEELGRLTGEPIAVVVENIARVREAIDRDRLKVWNLRFVVRLTQERLGVDDPVLLAAVHRRIELAEADESFLAAAKVALAITTSLLAGALLTPLAGAAVAAAWGVETLTGDVTAYRDESAAEGVALDAAVADLSLDEPTLTWIVLDAIFLALDVGAVARGLRPVGRALTAAPSALRLRAFRGRAAVLFGEDVAERLASRAASRFGITAAGRELAEQQLRAARQVLAGLDLSDEAVARVLAKGTHVEHLKGQLVEELAHRDIARRLAQGADRTLGVADRTGLEVLEGHRLSDLSGRELTDGMIVRRGRDGVLDVVTVVEAKAGPSAAQGLRRTASELGDPEEFARFVIEQERSRVVTVLRTAGLGADADAVARGAVGVSDAAVDAIAREQSLRRVVTQAELGGQVRRDVERLAPGADDAGDVVTILVDGAPTPVRLSPTRTRFVGALPSDVPAAAIEADLARQGFSYATLPVDVPAARVTALAERLATVVAAAPAP
ncbi:hypothetical protein [Cellulosimicrobium sp. NPDC055967]|uniref:hypothetical protein n=1 Tax=Cellulosimicrobium sp. NPDC055967 TaxID=3345670 RepID=UPI0035DF7299